MGIEEVYNFLKRRKGFYSVKQISDALELTVMSIRESLNTVMRYDDIVCEFKHLDIRRGVYKSGLKTKRTWVYAHVNSIKNSDKKCL